ncbi:MAG: hypothetical protein WBG37_19010 [Desulfobacterales bacterium]
MKSKLLFLGWSIYFWLGTQSGDPLQLFFAGFFFLLHIGTLCQRRELRTQRAKVSSGKK